MAAPQAKGGAPGMTVTEFGPQLGHVYKIHFHTGDDLTGGMAEFAAAHGLKQATVTGVGGFASAVLSWYDPTAGFFKKIVVDQKSEVTSFVGTVATNAHGETVFHAHVALALSDGATKSGHLVSAVVNPTMDVYVTDLGEGREVK